VLFVLLDNFRLDQWATVKPLLAEMFNLEESLYTSILPTATQYARNAIFSGLMPLQIATLFPDLWVDEESEDGKNLNESPLIATLFERYRRRETSVEEAMIEMYLAGVSTRRIEDVSEILWGSSVSAATVSNLNEKAFAAVEEWRNRPLVRAYPYVYVDGIYLKRSWGGSYENVAVMVAIGVNDDGYREVIGAAEGFTESAECWR